MKTPFIEPFETDCDPCLAPDCPHTVQCIKKLQAKIELALLELEHIEGEKTPTEARVEQALKGE